MEPSAIRPSGGDAIGDALGRLRIARLHLLAPIPVRRREATISRLIEAAECDLVRHRLDEGAA